MRRLPRHVPLSDRDIAELRAMCVEGAFSSGEAREQLSEYVSHLILDLLAVRIELRREQQRARTELERLRDLLDRVQPLLLTGAADPDVATLRAEIVDALARRAR